MGGSGVGLWGCGVVGLWGFLWCRGWGFVGVGKFSPAGSTRNPLRRPATFPGWEGVWRRSAGLVWGASGGALRPLTPGFPAPHRRTPAPGALAAKETVGTAIPLGRGIADNGCGVCVVVRSCDGTGWPRHSRRGIEAGAGRCVRDLRAPGRGRHHHLPTPLRTPRPAANLCPVAVPAPLEPAPWHGLPRGGASVRPAGGRTRQYL